MKPEIKQRIEQIKAGQVPDGYKKTKIGIVPTEWNICKLKDVLEKQTKKNKDNTVKSVLTNSATKGIISQNDFFDKQIANSNNISGYYIVKNGYFVYNPRISVSAPCGPFNKYYGEKDGIMSPLYTVYKYKDVSEYYSEFLSLYFSGSSWYSYMNSIANYGARSDRMNVTSEDMDNMPLPYPPLAEQEKIAKILSAQDKIIELYQRKIEELHKMKKVYLSKMFPKKGENVPEWRFPQFTDAWEQRKLGEILIEHNIRTSDFENNPLYSLTIESGITPKTERYERSSLVTKTEYLFKVVKPNEFVTNPMNLRFGALGYNTNPFDISVSGYYDVFSIDNDKCSGFWNSYFKTPIAMKIFDNAATGSLIEKRRVKYSTLQQLDFYMPKMLEEKILIGRYMDFLDHLITLHQRKLEETKKYKKALMQLLLTGIVRCK